MNRSLVMLAVAAAFGGAARAQSSASAPVAQPSSPAPAVVEVSNPAAAQPAVNQTVYTPQLPTAADLTNAAAAQGYTVERIVQTSTQVIAFYRNANGQATTVAYQSLPPTVAPATAAPAGTTQVVTQPAPRVVVTSPPPATVVYETAPSVVYYDYPRYYYPRAYYPPVSIGFGFGYRSYGGHYRGGHSHGGFHRR